MQLRCDHVLLADVSDLLILPSGFDCVSPGLDCLHVLTEKTAKLFVDPFLTQCHRVSQAWY